MNLKAFHIFFIVCSTLMSLGVAALYTMKWNSGEDPGALLPAVAWFLGAVTLMYYGNYFLKKFKDWGYYET